MPAARPHRLAAFLVVVAGSGLFGVATGRLAGMDGELRAAVAPAPSVQHAVADRHCAHERRGL
jgi:hypothetical protein